MQSKQIEELEHVKALKKIGGMKSLKSFYPSF